jgi:hypothetical protein
MDGADPGLAAAATVARRLLDSPVDTIERVRGRGRNSRVYRVCRGSRCFAVKQYPPPHEDPRSRLKTEIAALELMERNRIAAVPRALASDAESGYALLSWIEGEPVDGVDEADIEAAADFLAGLHRLRHLDEARLQPLAAEACLSGTDIVAQVAHRMALLGGVALNDAALAEFLEQASGFLFARVLPTVAAGYRSCGLSFALPLPDTARSLCPSDLGFHNALRNAAGLTFIDFEYFGWDDPVKLVCDFLLHPEPLKRRFVAAALQIYRDDPVFARRLGLLFPLFGLRWCLILLNEFLPERWTYRVHAGVELDWAAAKRRQLALANDLLQFVQLNDGGFPYGN